MSYLAQKSECTGCSACMGICPQKCLRMERDKYGFLRPMLKRPDLCLDCGLCGRVCPVQAAAPRAETTEAWAAVSLDAAARAESSSGGVFTELARGVLGRGGIVFGAAYDENFNVRHIGVEREAELGRLRGAKYAQSDLGDCFAQVRAALQAGRPTLFSGTPCQVAGLKAVLRGDDAGLLTVDLVCHSVPAPAVWARYVRYRAGQDAAGRLPERINLRSKHTGWSRYAYSNLYEYPDGARYCAGSGDDLFMRLFVGDYICRESCATCRFKGFTRTADITLGDFWGVWGVAPEMDDNRGTSLVLTHSETGRAALAALEGRVRLKRVTLEQAAAQNPAIVAPAPMQPQRAAALQACLRGDFLAAAALLPTPPARASLSARALRKLRGVLGR